MTSPRAGSAPLVSVVVPNYNHAPFLGARLDSILAQSVRDIEVILLDDASTDDSRSVIARYASRPRVRVTLNETNSGSTFRQWNAGVGMARGRYVWIAESDDLAEPDLLEKVVGALEANPACGVGCCESWLFEGEGPPDPATRKPHYRPGPRRDQWTRDFVADGADICVQDLLFGNVMPNASAVVFRRSLFHEVGGADETMLQSGDRMLWARMLARSDLAHVADRLNYYRTHDATVRSRTGASARTVTEVYSVLRFIRGAVPTPADAFERALRANAAYFALASARRGVPVGEMMRACREIADVDPRVVTRLLLPFLRHRMARVPRAVARSLRATVRAAAPERLGAGPRRR